MLTPGIYWPIEYNTIRKNSISNTFGMVRNSGEQAHQGWDLLAYPLTRCHAVADGVIKHVGLMGKYGNLVILEFKHRGLTLYAAYCHLSILRVVRKGEPVDAGQFIGLTGNTGNADSMTGDDQHLHFEIRTIDLPGKGLGGRLDPKDLYGVTPLHTTVHDSRLPALSNGGWMKRSTGMGLKVRGVNML